ncbi:GIY-YIG nuclease family protein [Candidatus Dependentiae bacterium]
MVDLSVLPKLPGIYIFKNEDGQVIYIGKAKCIKKRVSSYFHKNHDEFKVQALLQEHASIDYIVTKTETEALLLEAQLIRDYRPKFNILLKTGQPFVYILFTGGKLPKIKLVRNKSLDGKYYGPFLRKLQARKVFEYLVTTFRLNICNKRIENGCLDYHLGLCAGSCKSKFDKGAYLFRLQLAQDALKNNHRKLLKDLSGQMIEHNKKLEFEKSKHLREYINDLDVILHTIRVKFREDKFEDQVFNAVTPIKKIYKFAYDIDKQLQEFLNLENLVVSIDCFDISHFQSSFLVGSCIRFVNGKPDKSKFRKFKIKSLTEQNDCAALQEIVLRRYKDKNDLPDLILIDGGKGQLGSILKLDLQVPCVSLAKREETIFSEKFPQGIKLDIKTDVGRLLIALRDYAHHFAISYHRKRRSREF